MTSGVYPRLGPDERFDRQVDRSGECHLWLNALNNEGYANFWFEGKYIGAHVYAWIRVNGPLAPGQVVRHGPCHTRHCVRIEHLVSGTKGDNNRDRQRDGTQARGSKHHSAVLTEEQVLEGRRLHAIGVPVARIARDFGVNAETLRDAITARKSWKHLNDTLLVCPDAIDPAHLVDP